MRMSQRSLLMDDDPPVITVGEESDASTNEVLELRPPSQVISPRRR